MRGVFIFPAASLDNTLLRTRYRNPTVFSHGSLMGSTQEIVTDGWYGVSAAQRHFQA